MDDETRDHAHLSLFYGQPQCVYARKRVMEKLELEVFKLPVIELDCGVDFWFGGGPLILPPPLPLLLLLLLLLLLPLLLPLPLILFFCSITSRRYRKLTDVW